MTNLHPQESELDKLTSLETHEALTYLLGADGASLSPPRIAFLYIDLDHFKAFNLQYTHEYGNDLLRTFGALLRTAISGYTRARAFRHGGDEFVVLLEEYGRDEAAALGHAILDRVRSVAINGIQHKPVTASMGLADGSEFSRVLLARAEDAMNGAKREGRNRLRVWEPAHGHRARRRIVLNPQLYAAVDKSLRVAFIRVGKYQQARDYISQHPSIRLKCVSVLGRTDLMAFHLGDHDQAFFDDIGPLLMEADGGDIRNLKYFTVTRILKYHGYDRFGPQVVQPEHLLLQELIRLAQGQDLLEPDDERLQDWGHRGYVLGLEAAEFRDPIIEAYITLDAADTLPALIRRQVVDAVLLRDPSVVSIFEGVGVAENMQFLVRTRSTPTQLFDLIECLHRQCHDVIGGRLHTNTYLAVRTSTGDLLRSLLIPVLDANARHVRDAVILTRLMTADERDRFLLAEPSTHKKIINDVQRLRSAVQLARTLRKLRPDEPEGYYHRAVRAIATRDRGDAKYLYLDLVLSVEMALRECAVRSVKENFGSLQMALDAKVITSSMAHKELEKLTIGEVRDILRAFHQVQPEFARTLPPRACLDALQPYIDLRNQLAHSDGVDERVLSVLVDLVEFVARYDEWISAPAR